MVGEDDTINEINTFMKEEENIQKENFLMTDNSQHILKKRDNELNLLLNSVQDLAGIFKDMQSLVMEQVQKGKRPYSDVRNANEMRTREKAKRIMK